MKSATSLAKFALKTGVAASVFLWALNLTEPTRRIKAMILGG